MNTRLRVRPTREGLVALLALAGLLAVAMLSGNNLLFMLAAVGVALAVVTMAAGPWNLGGLRVARLLPPELYAGQPARGRFALKNRRRLVPALGVLVQELEGGEARARVGILLPGAETRVWAAWHFESRGVAELGRVRISSTWPLGLAVCWRDVDLPAEVPVYPHPMGGPWRTEPGGEGHEGGEARHGGGLGDFVGLRGYQPGDPVGFIHWPTSARLGVPMVVVRSAEAAERVVVRVADLRGAAWERELSRAAGQVLRGFSRGAPVGLELPEHRLEPRTGAPWRRTLLDALARAPWRGNL